VVAGVKVCSGLQGGFVIAEAAALARANGVILSVSRKGDAG
jgi:hypothetical protein